MAWVFIIYALFTLTANAFSLKAQDLVRFKFAQFSYDIQDASVIQDAVYNVACGQCLSACSTRKDCALVNYRRLIQQCRLFSQEEKDELPVTTDQTGSILVDKENIDVISIPVQCKRCSDGQTCDKTTGTCKTVECPKPQLVNARVYGNSRSIGSRLVFACGAGYIAAAGDDGGKLKSVTCQEDGTWSSSPICINTGCSQPPTIPNTIRSELRTTKSNSFQVTYTCDVYSNYHDKGGREDSTIECGVTIGKWTDPGIECVKGCGLPPVIPNTIRGTYSANKLKATYTCDKGSGYYDRGGLEEVTINCDVTTGTGIWTDASIDCVKDCPDPPEIVNTDRWTTANTPSSVTTYRCLYGARFKFNATCLGTSGTWTGLSRCPTDDVCDEYLVEQIPDSSLTASSYYGTNTKLYDNHAPRYARLTPSGAGAWVANVNDKDPYIQAEFAELKHIVGIVTMGRYMSTQHVKSYTVSYSRNWNCQRQIFVLKIFKGNTDTTSKQTNYLLEPLSARCIRLYPQAFESYISLRFDIIGCNDRCTTFLVSGDYGVSDASLTASNFYVDGKGKSAGPERARLDSKDTTSYYGGWVVKSSEDAYIQVRFRRVQDVSAVVTQRVDNLDVWVEKYGVSFSMDSDCNTTYMQDTFLPSTSYKTRLHKALPQITRALCVRIYPQSNAELTGMRFDLKGCVDYVCPESPERFVTPSFESSLVLRLMPGSYTKSEAEGACTVAGGQLVILVNEGKEKIVLNMIKGCSMYAGQVFWVDGELRESMFLFSDGTSRAANLDSAITGHSNLMVAHPCLAIGEEDVKFPIGVTDCFRKLGYICEKKPSDLV